MNEIGPEKITHVSENAADENNVHPGGRKFNFFKLFFGLLLLLLSIYFVLTSIRIYNKNLHSCSFKLIQVNITKKFKI